MAGPAAPPQGPPPEIQVNPADHPDNQTADPEQAIADALDQIRAALSADGFSDQEKLTLEKVTTLLQTLAATREKEHQAALGGGPATNFLRRASGG
jgi:hypothetical protein